jgi:hypothetical protein
MSQAADEVGAKAPAKKVLFLGRAIKYAAEDEKEAFESLLSPSVALAPKPSIAAAAAKVSEKKVADAKVGRKMFGEALLSPAEPLKVAKEAKGVKASKEAKAPKEAKAETRTDLADPSQFGELSKYAASIQAEEYKDPYAIAAADDIYPMQTRLGFQQQILKVYSNFIKIPEYGKEPDYDACKKMGGATAQQVEMYEYQKFVREYVRQASPYRGLLVYHGLGSGKTCSAIAAAEALYSVYRKKIIVMTPSSLRYNFIREISFCGFRHLRQQNFWEAIEITDDNRETVFLFATQILNMNVSFLKGKTRIWVPDFEKPEPNFKSLGDSERKEIVAQVEHQITNTIHFINYNGIRSSDLKKIACDPPDENGYRFFDNSVIVVDEIHNLTRLMQGTIEPYLTDIGGGKRKVPIEPVMPGLWEPALCKKPIDERRPHQTNYKRGYLLYRLLSGARNSKIIGLSGTPLINFPEEIAILTNLIGGYIHTCFIKANPADQFKVVRDLLQNNPYVDFEEVDTLGGNVQILFSILPEGMIKATTESGNLGVQRVPVGTVTPTIQETAAEIVKGIVALGMRVIEGPTYKSEPLLPPIGDEFRENFLNGLNLKNTIVLRKRLQGLVSYYRGSKKELMPEVTKDEVIFVPFSEYAQHEYERVRSEELTQQKEQKSKGDGGLQGVGKMGNLWADIYDLARMKQPNSYRMSSRQACNFAFPEGMVRPRPRDIKDIAVDIGNEKDDVFTEGVVDEEDAAEIDAAAADDAALDEGERSELLAEGVAREEVDGLLGQGRGEVEGAEPAAGGGRRMSVGSENFDWAYFSESDGGSRGVRTHILRESLIGGAGELADKEDGKEEEGKEAEDEEEEDDDEEEEEKEGQAEAAEADAEKVILPEPEAAPVPEPEAAPVPEPEPVPEPVAAPNPPPVALGAAAAAAIVPLAAAAVRPKKTTMNILKEQKEALKARILGAKKYDDATRETKAYLKRFESKKLHLFAPGQNITDMVRSAQVPDPERLSKYSPKYAKILYNIINAPGSSLVYSQFLDMEGIGIFSMVMEINDIHPIEIIPDDAGSFKFSDKSIEHLKLGPTANRFLTFTGAKASGKSGLVRNTALKLFNARYENESFVELPPQMSKVLVDAGFTGNSDGGLCRVFCITSAGAEGLSLKNVRRVHIMEPFWNSVRTDQVKGRAVRICSHIDLDLADRNVEVFTYCSTFAGGATNEIIRANDSIKPDEAMAMGFTVRPGATEYILTSDQHLYQLSERKKKVLQNIQNLMKTNAVDCAINKYENEEEGLGCITLPDNPKQYAYHPILKKDISETSTRFPKNSLEEAAAPPAPAGAAAPGAVLALAPGAAAGPQAPKPQLQKPRKELVAQIIKVGTTEYLSIPDKTTPLTQSLYARGDTKFTNKIGEYSVNAEGKAISKIRWIKERF